MRSILVAGAEAAVDEHLGHAAKECGYTLKFAPPSEGGLRNQINVDGADLLIFDLAMPFRNGFEPLQEIRGRRADLPIIVVSTDDSPRDIIWALQNGASDFLVKPVSPQNFESSVERVRLAHKSAEGLLDIDPGAFDPSFEAPTGSWSERIDQLLECASNSNVPLLLRGETGVGKEVIARKFHNRSPRARGPFLKINCAALPSELIESELFGYERGSFTGAFKTTPGKFELANGGTILLDEIGDMDIRLQAKLLQVLQDKEFMRIGASEMTRVDVRVMAATHRDIEAAITQGTFREDLFYRLNVIDVIIPPLRERVNEILPLAELFLRRHETPEQPAVAITPALRAALLQHDWPGNIRELENVMRKLLVLRTADWLAEELGARSRRKKPRIASRAFTAFSPRLNDLAETSAIRQALNTAQWDREKAAKLLGMDDNFLESRMRELAIQHGPIPVSDATEVLRSDMQSSSVLSEVDEARKAAESEVIMTALNSSRWNRKQAALVLGIDYKALLYKMKKLGIGENLAPRLPARGPAAETSATRPEKMRITATS